MKRFINSIITGIIISIAGTVYLSVDNKIIGSILFSFALMTVIKLKLSLFTGMIGYLSKDSAIDTLLTLLGNFTGIYLYTTMFSFTRNYESLLMKANELVLIKTSDSIISIFILSILCGFMMYIAVETNRRGRCSDIFIILTIVLFILCSFEHCVANFFFFSYTDNVNLIVLATMIVGNTVGSIALHQTLEFSQRR